MNRNKKWMVTLEDEQYEWIKKMADEARVKGSIIIGQLIARSMKDEDSDLKESLVEGRRRARLQELEDKKREIEAELKKLNRHQSGDNV